MDISTHNLGKNLVLLFSIDVSLLRNNSLTSSWRLSCSLRPNKCNFRLSSSKGLLEATLVKDVDFFNVGPSTLPFRLIDDKVDLKPFVSTREIEEYFTMHPVQNLMFTSSQYVEMMRNRIVGFPSTGAFDAFFCLRQTIATIWHMARYSPRVSKYYLDPNAAPWAVL